MESSLFDILKKPVADAVDVLEDKKTYRKPGALELDTISIEGEAPKKEEKPKENIKDLRKAQGQYEEEENKPNLMDALTTNLNEMGTSLSQTAEQVGEDIKNGYGKLEEFTAENPNFLIGMAPTLLGALTGELGLGAKHGAAGIRSNIKRQDAARKLASKKEGGSKPLSKSNIVPILGDEGQKVYSRVEDAVGKEIPQEDSFHEGAKMRLAEFKERLKNKSGIDFDSEQKLRKEYSADPITKDTKAMATSFNKIQDLASAKQSGANDISMIFAYMKMLDPASVVREGEQATARNAGAIPDSVRLMYNRLIGGEDKLLPPEIRKNFFVEAKRIYQGQKRLQEQVDNTYKSLASQYDLGPSRIANTPQVPITLNPVEGDVKYELVEQNGTVYVKLPNGTYQPVDTKGK